jgi:hypothetical protein
MEALKEVAYELEIIETMDKIYIGVLVGERRIEFATEYKRVTIKHWMTDFVLGELDTIYLNPNAGYISRKLDSVEKLELEYCLATMAYVKESKIKELEVDLFYKHHEKRK